MSLISSVGHQIRLGLYYGLARRLPDSSMPAGVLWRKLRYIICRPLFHYCGSNVNIESGAYIGDGRTISIGSNSGIGLNAAVHRGTRIGSNVMMGPEVLILTTNHRTSSTQIPMTDQGCEPTMPVTIGDNVWIGARAILLPGITVGSGSIVGAGAVVSRDVPEDAIVVGNPARIVRYRTGPGRLPDKTVASQAIVA